MLVILFEYLFHHPTFTYTILLKNICTLVGIYREREREREKEREKERVCRHVFSECSKDAVGIEQSCLRISGISNARVKFLREL